MSALSKRFDRRGFLKSSLLTGAAGGTLAAGAFHIRPRIADADVPQPPPSSPSSHSEKLPARPKGPPRIKSPVNRSPDLTVQVDFSKSAGLLKPVHGVNCGPWAAGSHTADMVTRHKEAGFPSVRLHDCNWPHPDVVDIPAIFPLFHLDHNDPSNYLFARTDAYLQPIIRNGASVLYRFGVSIEHKTAFTRNLPPTSASGRRYASTFFGITMTAGPTDSATTSVTWKSGTSRISALACGPERTSSTSSCMRGRHRH